MKFKQLLFTLLEIFFISLIIVATINKYDDAMIYINMWLIVIYLTMRRKEAKEEAKEEEKEERKKMDNEKKNC